MKILVTGGNGFVGRALVRALHEDGHDVVAPVRRAEPPDIGGVTWLPGFDFDSNGALQQALDDAEAVVHCAAYAHRTRRITDHDREQFETVNVGLSRRLYDAAVTAGVGQFVFISSIGALRAASDEPVTEQTPPAPTSDYGKSKLRAEQQLRSMARSSATELTILRPSLVYGPGNPGNMARLSRLVDTGLPLPFGRIDGTRSLIYIGNLCSAIIACLGNDQAYANDFNICDDEALRLPDLVSAIATAKGRKARLVPVPLFALNLLGRIGDAFAQLPGGGIGIDSYSVAQLTSSLPCSNRKARDVLGWRPPCSVADGLRRTFGG